MRAVEVCLQVLIGPRPCKLHDGRTQLESCGEAVFARIEQQEVQAKWLVGILADRRGSLADLLRAQIMAAQRSEAARTRNGSH
jgi:hypothetical protein